MKGFRLVKYDGEKSIVIGLSLGVVGKLNYGIWQETKRKYEALSIKVVVELEAFFEKIKK